MFKATVWSLLACTACAPTVAPDKTDEDIDGDTGYAQAPASGSLALSYYMELVAGESYTANINGVRPYSDITRTPWTTEHVWIAPEDLPVLDSRDLRNANYNNVTWTRQPFSEHPVNPAPGPLDITPPGVGDWILIVRVVVSWFDGEELIGSAYRSGTYEPPETDTGTVVAYPEPPWEAFSYNHHTWFHVTPAPTRADPPPAAPPTPTPTIAERIGATGP